MIKKTILPILLGLILAFAMMPMTAWKAYAAVGDYNLYVGGTRVSTLKRECRFQILIEGGCQFDLIPHPDNSVFFVDVQF